MTSATVLHFPLPSSLEDLLLDPRQANNESGRREDAIQLITEALHRYRQETCHDAVQPWGPDDPEHRLQHEFMTAWLEARRRRTERWEKISTSVIGGFILMVIGGLGTVFYWVGSMVVKGASGP